MTETPPNHDTISAMATEVLGVISESIAEQAFDGNWAILAQEENGPVFIFKGTDDSQSPVEMFVRPFVPHEGQKRLLNYLKAVGSPKERDFYEVPPEATTSFPAGMVRAVAQLPGAAHIRISSYNGRVKAEQAEELMYSGKIHDLATPLAKALNLLRDSPFTIYNLSPQKSTE